MPKHTDSLGLEQAALQKRLHITSATFDHHDIDVLRNNPVDNNGMSF